MCSKIKEKIAELLLVFFPSYGLELKNRLIVSSQCFIRVRLLVFLPSPVDHGSSMSSTLRVKVLPSSSYVPLKVVSLCINRLIVILNLLKVSQESLFSSKSQSRRMYTILYPIRLGESATQSDLQVKTNTLIGSQSKRPALDTFFPTSLHRLLVPTSERVRHRQVDRLRSTSVPKRRLGSTKRRERMLWRSRTTIFTTISTTQEVVLLS